MPRHFGRPAGGGGGDGEWWRYIAGMILIPYVILLISEHWDSIW